MSWTLRTADLDDLARGAALLGTGGGGDPFVGKMLVTQALGEAGEITILDPEELDDDAWVIPSRRWVHRPSWSRRCRAEPNPSWR